MVGVLKVENVLLEGPKISDYHSFQFYPKHMKLWRYYGIGEGIEVKYNNRKTPISAEVIKPYSRTDSHPTITSYTEEA